MTRQKISVSASEPISDRPPTPWYRLIAALGFALIAGLTLSLVPGPAGAQAPAAVIGIVDFPNVIRESLAAKDVRKQIEVIRQEYDSAMGKIERELREADQELMRQRSILSPEAFAAERRAFEKKFIAAEKELQDRQRRLDRVYGKALREIEGQVLNIIAQLAQERAVNLVLGKTAIVIAEPRFDMSDEVLTRLNKALPSVRVEHPGP